MICWYICIILILLFCNGFELEFDSWEYVDIEVNVGLGDEVEYKVVMM